MLSRRNFLKTSAILATLLAGGYIFRSPNNTKVKHILCSASHEKLAVSTSLSKGVSSLDLILDDKIKSIGKRIDREGKHWQFLVNELTSDKTYELQLTSQEQPLYRGPARQ